MFASNRDFIYTYFSLNAEVFGISFDEVTEKYFQFMEILFKGRELFSAAFGLSKPELRKIFEEYLDEKIEAYFAAKEKYKTEPKKLLDWYIAEF